MNIEEIITLLVTTIVGISLGSYISSHLIRRGLVGDVRKIITEDLAKVIKEVIDRDDVKILIVDMGKFAKAGKEFFESEEIKLMTKQARLAFLGLGKDGDIDKKMLDFPKRES